MDISYGETLQKYGLEMNNGLSEQIETADLPLAKAILTCYVRQERFCEGALGNSDKERRISCPVEQAANFVGGALKNDDHATLLE